MSNERSDPWPTMVGMGILCGLTLGLVILLLFRRRETQALLPASTDLGDLGLDDLSFPTLPSKGNLLKRVERQQALPVARTVNVSNTSPTMILQAVGSKPWSVWCRTVGPPGAFASFIIGGNKNDMIWVPAGQAQRMTLPRGEFLFAQGDIPGVCVSVSGGEG